MLITGVHLVLLEIARMGTANAEDPNGYDKQCSYLWGVGCGPDKWGATFHHNNDCE
ncbi:MAG: hypothetical protein Q8T08_07270 [Ignavibacteria bacterium]|nr:hypothetical protein [Ignavibacteria bacterium]